VLIIILDGRNPLYFRCPDLEGYIKDVNNDKEVFFIINKSDLLSDDVRKSWAEYFAEHKMKYVFFSALEEIVKIENEEDEPITESIKEDKKEEVSLDIKIHNREELIKVFKSLTGTKKKYKNHDFYSIGFIGYPNVGKSSVINVLMKKKRVGVAMMPGKTKHYQTLFLPDDKEYCLMDCPGLVFPSFTSSKADMLVNGILPIDTLREYHEAISIIIKRIPRKVLASYYKIELADIYSATQFLQTLATKRGFYSGRNLPDEAKTAKLVLKDYVAGRLLYCNLRPDYDEMKHGIIINYQEIPNLVIDEAEKEKQNLIKEIPADFDENFEKINLQFENLKVKENDDDVDRFFFDSGPIDTTKDSAATKDMRRALKFCLKRGEVILINLDYRGRI
jgi:large subunit GTPase 1